MPRHLTRTVTLSDGKQLTLTANMNTFADFEELTGKSFSEADRSAVGMRARIWAFAHQAHPELTPRDVGAMLGLSGPDFDAVLKAITELAEAMNPPA